MNYKIAIITLMMISIFACFSKEHPNIESNSITCIKPMSDYTYQTCNEIDVTVDDKLFKIPPNFETDLATIPKLMWPIIAPYHASIVRPSIIHDWMYSNICEFSRKKKDIIFYYMLRNEGVSTFKSYLMYYAVRMFGASRYKEIYCGNGHKEMDKAS